MIPDTTTFTFWDWKQAAVDNLKAGLNLESSQSVLLASLQLEQTGFGSLCATHSSLEKSILFRRIQDSESFNLIILTSTPVLSTLTCGLAAPS